jgi:uncharacterized repeat protein (TIGR03803 family)
MKQLNALAALFCAVCVVFLFCTLVPVVSKAQTLTTYNLCPVSTNCAAAEPAFKESMVQGTNGNLYGTTGQGGSDIGGCGSLGGCGTVFEITSTGTITAFNGFDDTGGGHGPTAGVVIAANGNFYGTTTDGGVNGGGTVFKMTPAGVLTTLYSFCSKTNCEDGLYPYNGLVLGASGNFYGTTFSGGTGAACDGCGTIFKITPAGVLTTLYNFCALTGCPDGEDPSAALALGTDGNFYGTTAYGGASNAGTVFKITTAGQLTTLHSFAFSDGDQPEARLFQGSDGNFYGTTQLGGSGSGQACNGCGTAFKITTAGVLTTLYNFCSQANCSDGAEPLGALIQATDGNFYGTTSINGAYNDAGCIEYETCGGTVFQMTAQGTLTTLYSFCAQGNINCPDGTNPHSGVVQATNGTFYGTTFLGGDNNAGTAFGLSTGLGPFVETLPASGKVAAAVRILGTDLTGATSVTFSGTTATFKVPSATEITTTVPTGATTGTVEVTTPRGSLNSSVAFSVTPQIKSFTPESGPVGTQVQITGVSLKQATTVTFDGVAASFTVNSDTQLTATVPTGAKTGKIAITTPGGTVTSAANFKVTG